MYKPREGKERTVRTLSLALRQRIFGSIRTQGSHTVWCGNPADALIFKGKKRGIHEVGFFLFCEFPEGLEDPEIAPCQHYDLCIAPNHLGVYFNGERLLCKWDRLMIGLEDRCDIVKLRNAGVSKRTLQQWYMLETKELDYVLRTMK